MDVCDGLAGRVIIAVSTRAVRIIEISPMVETIRIGFGQVSGVCGGLNIT